MIVPPHSTKYSKRSLKKVQLKRKKAASTADKARQKPRSVQKRSRRLEVEDPQEHFAAASELLKNVIQSPEISESFDPQMRTNTRMVYTKGVTLWMLILQRLGNGLSLEDTVFRHSQITLPIFTF